MTTTAHPDDETLAQYAEGALTSGMRTKVLRHLAGCDDCRNLTMETIDFVDSQAITQPSSGNARNHVDDAAQSLTMVFADLLIALEQATTLKDVEHIYRVAREGESLMASLVDNAAKHSREFA